MEQRDRPIEKKIAEAKAIFEYFPDAVERIDRQSEYCHYHSNSIFKNSKLQFNYSGGWHNLSISPYVNISFMYKNTTYHTHISSDPSFIKLVNLDFPNGVMNDIAYCNWNNPENLMIKLGFTENHIKKIYKHYIVELSKVDLPNVKLIKESFPSFIRDLMIFL